LGTNRTARCQGPTLIPLLPNAPAIVAVSAGNRCSACLYVSGSVLVLGLFGDERKPKVQQVDISNIISIACGPAIFCLNDEGNVFSVTSSTTITQLNISNIISICSSANQTILLDSEGQIFEVKNTKVGKFPSFAIIEQVAVGRDHALFLDSMGRIWGKSEDGDSKNAIGSTERNRSQPHLCCRQLEGQVRIISCGIIHTMIITVDNELIVFGGNHQGQTGLGVSCKCCALEYALEVYKRNPELQLKNIEFVSTGGYHTFCKDYEGNVWAFGRNTEGQLGNRAFEDSNVPIKLKDKGDICFSDIFWPQRTSRAKSARK